jgi:isoamylase
VNAADRLPTAQAIELIRSSEDLRGAPEVAPGQPYPLGASCDGAGVNFALYSEHATRVELLLFRDATDQRPTFCLELPARSGPIWHGHVADLTPGWLYGYRVSGPFEPKAGHRFNRNKVLLDPYARCLGRPLRWHDSLFGYRVDSGRGDRDLRPDDRDSAAHAPLGLIVADEDDFDWQGDTPPGTPWDETVIYEAHVKGLTMRHPAVPEAWRGTYRGLSHPAVIEHLVELGVTAVELLPIQAFVSDRHLEERGLRNYWGYQPLAFFAPEPGYVAGAPAEALREVKQAVRALHAAGLEVLIDVVYNHTGEGNQLGPTLCYRGLDNAAYYKLSPEAPRYTMDFTGTGNTLDMGNPFALKLALDSLRYWVEELHIDGFRFDLAAALGRDHHDVYMGGGFFKAIAQDPLLSQVKLIAEPWDVGPDGYRLGQFPWPWAEWNAAYRDTVRKVWRGDKGQLGQLATRLSGSSDIYDHRRHPQVSVNFISAHDGFTLEDLVSYTHKHNEANGEGGVDGHDDNLSANWGAEGQTEDAAVVAKRELAKRGLLASLLLSQGVPMLLGGDELSRTQQGNNNGYCQDNELSWLDWELDERREDFLEFVRDLVAFRRAHPTFRRRHFAGERRVGQGEQRCKELSWWHPRGREMRPGDWHGDLRALGMLLCGLEAKQSDAPGGPLDDETFLLVINGAPEPTRFVLPRSPWRGRWQRKWSGCDAYHAPGHRGGKQLHVPSSSLLIFKLA